MDERWSSSAYLPFRVSTVEFPYLFVDRCERGELGGRSVLRRRFITSQFTGRVRRTNELSDWLGVSPVHDGLPPDSGLQPAASTGRAGSRHFQRPVAVTSSSLVTNHKENYLQDCYNNSSNSAYATTNLPC